MRKPVLPAILALAVAGTTWAGDLSKYRTFQLGTDLATVAKQADIDPSGAKLIHLRPALLQELSWRPTVLGPSPRTGPQEVVFSFFNNELYRIVVNYDPYETEGMTSEDMVSVFSATYGDAAKPLVPAETMEGPYGDQEEVLARWQDAHYRFELIRSAFGPSFKLAGFLKRLESPAKAAALEAKRLDDQEAPQREAARIASEDEAARVRSEKARLVNKPKFRP